MSRQRPFPCFLATFAWLLFVPVSLSWGQIINVTNATSTPVPGSGHDYIEMLSETVNPANGSVSVRINVPAAKGRRLTLPMGYAYDSNGIFHVLALANGTFSWVGNDNALQKGGWRYSIPTVTNTKYTRTYTSGSSTYRCDYRTGYVFEDPAGTRHSLDIALRLDSWGECHYFISGAPYTKSPGGDEFVKASISGGAQVTDASGTVYQFANTYPPDGRLLKLSSIKDTNGNMVTVTNSATGGDFTVQDTAGRNVFQSSGFGTTGDTLSVSGLPNPYSLTWGTFPTNYSSGGHRILADEVPCTTFPQQVTGSKSEITRITLPNGKYYTLEYDSVYGLLKKMTYPTGGYIRYEWATNPDSDHASSKTTRPDLYPAGVCHYLYGAPVVRYRYVSYDGTQDQLKQEFTYATAWSGRTWTSKTTTVKTYDLKRSASQYFTTTYTFDARSVPPPPNESYSAAAAIPVEVAVTYSAWGSPSTILKAVTKDWQGPYLLTKEDVTLDGSLLSKSSLTYEPCGGSGPIMRVSERKECDGNQDCSSSWQRKTSYVYDASSSTICDRPSSVTIAGSGGQAAQTTYTYGTAVVPASVTVGRDLSYNGNSSVPRGNVTRQSKWLHDPPNPDRWLDTDYTYDDTGQMRSATDPKDNPPTTYDFADSYTSTGCSVTGSPPGQTNAYLTRITRPSTGGTSHIETFTYCYKDGKKNSSTDENSRTTSYYYGESSEGLDRLTGINYPDCVLAGTCNSTTHSAKYDYHEAAYPFYLTATVKQSPNPDRVTNQYVDGLGQATKSTVISVTPNLTTSQTDYDGMGRGWKVYNPAEGTPADFTRYDYDALGRVTLITHQDGNTTQTSYNGNCTTVTDPQTKKRKTCSDSLGRVVDVYEDPDALNYHTLYRYDVLDNLACVLQGGTPNPTTCVTTGGQARSFLYDSLSRLTSATNPENNTTTYSYDDNGNVVLKTDARAVKTCYGNWTGSSCDSSGAIGYDELNRLKMKSYSDITPRACFKYDESSALITGPSSSWTSPTLTNPVGRLTHTMTTTAADCATSRVAQTATVSSYDPVGRVERYWQCTSWNCGVTGNSPWLADYEYDLAGGVEYFDHPIGYRESHQIDGAGRITQITSSYVSATRPGTIATITYAPHGAITTLVNGCAGTGCTQRKETYDYNKRLQPVRIQLGTTANPSATFCHTYNYYPGATGWDTCAKPADGTSSNNGNVMGSWLKDNDTTLSPNIGNKATYTYDALNRLITSIATPVSPGTKAHNLDYFPDQFGNTRCVTDGQTQGPCANWGFNTSTNRITTSGFTYDAAGNLTASDSPRTYQWDAEGRLKSINNPSGQPCDAPGVLACETYNALGQRVDHVWPGNRINWLYHPDGSEMSDFMPVPWNAWGNTYFNLNGRPIAKFIGADNPEWPVEMFFFHANALGSTSMMTWYNGDVVQKELFYPYGQLWATGGSVGSYRFASLREYLPVSDPAEIFMSQTRDYPSRFYRWMSPDEFRGGPVDAVNASFGGPDATPPGPLPYADILNPQSLNKYQYAYNNPLRFNDPTGRDAWDVLLGFANAISSNAGATERMESDNEDLQRGQFVGDVASVLVGSIGALSFGTAAVATEFGTAAVATPVAVAEAGAAAQLGMTAAKGLYHLSKSSTSGENEAAARGREAHRNYDPGPGYQKEVRLPGGRADAVNRSKGDVRELKPNNPRAIKKGERQLERYKRALKKLYRKKNWTGAVDTYE